ncbi:ATP synthase F0, A subunit [Sulfurihydrogenibium sp. YO3AOP1]|uniref:ATP synthase subunit a n=1 Tax=Sulfurihydrogenibium sp. (strain YO3AOP1) TaxID=436114 RepID=ATP6_SULSY|nr:F0F1 ATP synthase subunit A [Sulfurihydrogenibium sp. YO3AOP1]B2V9G8.1 RecName: Full=ATP synthase subunit a; AltName: Full=ATP synthase F0 sector subunit a; AltName: Full=F-ATPase subunit 6 [Sulfurihydrogenibium sp. YO3AOP1]ACD66591.1 ATP synthase F0, A subunit [Sulfurihydrogenibium sp. YO3AOP1]
MEQHVIMALTVLIVVPVIFTIFAKKPSLIPTPIQNVFEIYIEFIDNLIKENMGEKGRKYFPLIASIGLFVFFGNLLGIIPGLESPTANLNTTMALALLVFFIYNFEGIRENGIGYFKHFLGPVPAMAPVFVIIELLSHLSRPVTLALRLFANMTGGELISVVLIMLVPFLIPMPVMLIHLIAVFLQTYVFVVLTTVYIAGAITHAEH